MTEGNNIIQSSITCNLVIIFTMVAHFVCILFSGFVAYVAQPGSSLFSWHPVLMTAAFSLLMTESVLLFSPISSLVLKSDRKTKVQLHWIGMLLALICAAGGTFIIWYNKELSGKSHMTSWHGTFGYVTVVYTAIQSLAGVTVKYPSLVKSIIPRLADLKLYHATSGLLLFTLAYVTLVLAMFSQWFVDRVTGTSWYACLVCPAILVLMIMTQITSAYAPRVQSQGKTLKR